MVSWRVWLYIPAFIVLVLELSFAFMFPLMLGAYLLVFGIFKIFTRQCIRKYITAILAAALLLVTIFPPISFTSAVILLILMFLDVI